MEFSTILLRIDLRYAHFLFRPWIFNSKQVKWFWEFSRIFRKWAKLILVPGFFFSTKRSCSVEFAHTLHCQKTLTFPYFGRIWCPQGELSQNFCICKYMRRVELRICFLIYVLTYCNWAIKIFLFISLRRHDLFSYISSCHLRDYCSSVKKSQSKWSLLNYSFFVWPIFSLQQSDFWSSRVELFLPKTSYFFHRLHSVCFVKFRVGSLLWVSCRIDTLMFWVIKL